MTINNPLIRIYTPWILCSLCKAFWADWFLRTTETYYCSTCVEKLRLEDVSNGR